MKAAARRPLDQIVADRAAILPFCDGTRTVKEIAEELGRYAGDVWADVYGLRRAGHTVPVKIVPPCLESQAALYRHFSADGRLLYVGCSAEPLQRTKLHASKSHWFREIARIEIEWFDSGDDAYAAERAAIRTERPLYNVRDLETRSAD